MLQVIQSIDQSVFLWFHNLAPLASGLWKFLAIWGVYVVPLMLVAIWFVSNKQVALRSTIISVFAWLVIANLLGELFGRERPVAVHDLQFPVKEFLFDRPGPSFPSDHATFLVALVVSLWLGGEHNWAKFLGGITVFTLVARIVTAQHWPSDIIAGVVLGGAIAWVGYHSRGWIDRWLVVPLIGLARRLKLA